EHATQVCEHLLESGLLKSGAPLSGVRHGPRARFRWLRKEPLAEFSRHFDFADLSSVGGRQFEQVVVVRSLLVLGCSVRKFCDGYRRKQCVGRLLLQRPEPTPEEAGLQQSVAQGIEVKDCTPCVVYADWLEEQGHAYLAARFRNVEDETLA